MFNIFGKPAQQQQTQQQPNQQQQQTQVQGAPTASGNQNLPGDPAATANANGQMPGTSQLPVNPLDAYAKLWDTTDKAPEAPPSFNLDPKLLDDVSGKLNFTQSVDPELMQKATTGDVQALIQIMNQVGQASYKAALSHGSALTDKFVGARSKFDLDGIGSKVKSEMTQAHFNDVPNSNHPVVKAELKRLATAMQKENPDASPQQIATAAKEYYMQLAAAMNPDSAASQQQKNAPAETDWDKYFE